MDKSLVHDYLKRSGMEAAQAEALAQILGQTATHDDLLLVHERLRSMQQQLDGGLSGMQQQLDGGLSGMQQQLDGRLGAMQRHLDLRIENMADKVEGRLIALEKKMSDLKSDLTWRMVALMVALVTIVTALDRLAG